MNKNPNRVTGGKKAKKRGDETEEALIKAFNDLNLCWTKTYPQAKKFGKIVRFTGKGAPDFITTVHRELTGLPVAMPWWLEIKHVSAVNTITIGNRIHQFDDLVRNYHSGGLSGYFVLWRMNGTQKRPTIDEWRYYPIDHIDKASGGITILGHGDSRKIQFDRYNGILLVQFRPCEMLLEGDVWSKTVGIPDISAGLNYHVTRKKRGL